MQEDKVYLFQQLSANFDKVYILTLTNRPERRQLIESQFEKLGLPNPDDSNFIRYYYATPFPYNDIIASVFNSTQKGRFTKSNEFDCSRNHYAMVKICYDLGMQHCLILEDDILIKKDPKVLADYISDLPKDYDIVQFGGFSADPRILDYMDTTVKWVRHKPIGLWTTAGYALSRKGMEFYLAYMDHVKFWVADGPLYKAPLNDKIINVYMSNQPLVIQADKNIISSDIRTSDNDNIDYNNDNKYESRINIDEYFSVDITKK